MIGRGSTTISSVSKAFDSEIESDWVNVILDNKINPIRVAPKYQVLLSKKSCLKSCNQIDYLHLGQIIVKTYQYQDQ